MELRPTLLWLLAFVIVTALGFAAQAYVRRRRRARKLEAAPEVAPEVAAESARALALRAPELAERAPGLGPRLIDFDAIAPCHPTSWHIGDQPQAWRDAMAALGSRLERADVAELIFVHGTLVGDDPWALASLVPIVWPRLQRSAGGALQRLVKTGNDRVLRDLGNFAREYVELCRAGLGGKVACSSFVWSSANHHLARVRAALALAQRLASAHPGHPSETAHVLLVGHSHAGQVFALLTRLLAGGTEADAILEAALGPEQDPRESLLALDRVRELQLDLVTLGMSPRYDWGEASNCRVLHLLNYHPELVRVPLGAIRSAARGDYMQRFGSAGSDFPAWTEPERRTNTRLDELLGTGSDWKHWLAGVRSAPLLAPRGMTYLVRYRDVSTGTAPKLVDTYFGHGVYTRKGALLFTLEQIADFFYPAANSAN